MLMMSNFSFSHSAFYPFGELSTVLIKFEIVVCKLFKKNMNTRNFFFSSNVFKNLPPWDIVKMQIML